MQYQHRQYKIKSS